MIPLVVALAGVLTGCDDDALTAPTATTLLAGSAPTESLTDVTGVIEVVGEAGPDSTYALFRPAEWNGGPGHAPRPCRARPAR